MRYYKLDWVGISVWYTRTRPSISIKCPDSGIQVGSVLPKGTIYSLGLASDVNFICALLQYLMLHFSFEKKTTPKLTYRNQIRDLTNSNNMHIFLTFN